MAFNKFPSSSFLTSDASVSSFGLDVRSITFKCGYLVKGSSGSGGGGEDLGNDDIGDEGQSSTGLGGGSTGYSGSGAGAGSGVPCGFWDDDDAISSCLGAGGAFHPSIKSSCFLSISLPKLGI
ncbi:hypothetical protein EV359DRAFT_86225 [Lentinula novae-zelandiae]|nr:hypothetical protein EV359DRAFT_86225 [Lentinula novae-zelandiae]